MTDSPGYRQRPEVVAHKKIYDREYRQRPGHKKKQKEYDKTQHSKPEVKIREKIYTKNRRNSTKQALMEYKGGRCARCGLTATRENFFLFDFHHSNPEEKEDDHSLTAYSIERAKKVVDKCIMLCSNCHKTVHWSK